VLKELQVLHRTWGQPLGYLIEHVSAGADKRPRVREHFEAVRGILGLELVLDAAQLGSRAHRLRACWTNLEGMALLRAALGAQTRPAGLFVHQVLGPGRRARAPKTAGVLPWARIEVPGEARRALNTFVSYWGSYAYSRGGGGVLTCIQPNGDITYEEPTADERALAMGFPRGFTAAAGVSESTQRKLLGQAMDLNSVMWILAATREAGARRLPLGGEALRVRLSQERGPGAPGERPHAVGVGGARGGGRVSPLPQPVEKGPGPGAPRGQPQAMGVGGARGGGRVSPLPQPVEEGPGPWAPRGQPQAVGVGGACGGGRVSPLPQPVEKGPGPGAPRGQPQAVGVGGARGGGRVSPLPQPVEEGPKAEAVCLAPSASAAALGQSSDGGTQPSEAAAVGDGPNGEGWKVGAQLTKEEGANVSAVVERNRGVFAFSLEEIGGFKLFEVELKLKLNQPIFERRRRHSVREWELVDERCRELEAAGIIEECDSDFAANSVMAAKKDPEGNWKLARFCTDLRRINEQTAQDRYPMPLPEEVLEGLGHAKFYSTIDIRGAFHQLVVKQADRRKLAFWSSSKLYCWKRCPFEARNASAWFQRAIDRTLRGLEGFARSFVDDLLVAGGETVEEHMELVRRVLERLQEVGLRCHPEKCCFAATEVEYLGMWLRPGMVSPQVAKVCNRSSAPAHGCHACAGLLRRGQLLQAIHSGL
jgi:hypothetical protein